jgi:hypothetical protein
MEQAIPPEIAKQLFWWNIFASSLRALYVVLGLFGVVAPLIVASFVDALATWGVRALSFLASASVAVFAAFDIGNLATRWREAWKHLNAARLDYEVGIIKIEGLAKAYREGEAMIGKMKPDLLAKSPKDK